MYKLFESFPVDVANSFFETPYYLEKSLCVGIDECQHRLKMAQLTFDKIKVDTIKDFLNDFQSITLLPNFCYLPHRRTIKYKPIMDYEDFDADVEMERMKAYEKRIAVLFEKYKLVKVILAEYGVSLFELNESALAFYKKREDTRWLN